MKEVYTQILVILQMTHLSDIKQAGFRVVKGSGEYMSWLRAKPESLSLLLFVFWLHPSTSTVHKNAYKPHRKLSSLSTAY